MADQTSQPDSPAEPSSPGEKTDTGEKVETLDPQRLLRIAGVTREVLDEARRIRPEAGAVDHLRRLHDQIYEELREALPSELYAELDDLTPDLRDGSLEELSLAHAEILGWLEGLFQGTQLALQMQVAQAARQSMRERSRPGLPSPDA
ncbi:MAG TPA: proteasome activator, partial [Actinomycetota bacterium]